MEDVDGGWVVWVEWRICMGASGKDGLVDMNGGGVGRYG